MGIFDKIRARREEKKAKKNMNWDNPTQPKSKPAYKQKGFDAGEGTGSQKPTTKKPTTTKKSTFKPKTQEELKSTEVKPNTNSVVKNAKLPGRIEKTPVVEKKSAFDLEDEMHQRGIDKKNAEVKKKAETEAKKEADAKDKKEADASKSRNSSKKTSVVNQEATKKSGYKTYYTKAQLENKKAKSSNERIMINRKAKAAAKSGEIYTQIDSEGRKRRAKKP